jgi:cyclin C
MAVPLRAIVAERQLGARQLERSVLDEIIARDASAGWSSGDNELAKLYYSQLTEALGRRVKLRQPAVATAIVFFRRFYSERSLLDADPLLIAPTALWAASKVEECPVAAKTILRELSELEQQQPYETAQLIAAEPMLLEALGFALLVPHPHVPLARLCKHAITAAAEGAANEPMSADERESLVHAAHALLTDCYKTDVVLWCPPLALALACLQTVITHRRHCCRAVRAPSQPAATHSPVNVL